MVKRGLGLLLILVGTIALAWVGFHFASAAWFDHQTREALEILRQAPPPPVPKETPTPDTIAVGEPIGTLENPVT